MNKNSAQPRVPISYVHKREIDRFLELKDARNALPPVLLDRIQSGHGRMPSIRVTRDEDNRIIAKIIKVKIQDLHIHMPRAMLDCRITVNVEVDYHGSLEGLEDGIGQPDRSDRHKDRLSYKQGAYQVDLTQVTQPDAGPGPQVCLSEPPLDQGGLELTSASTRNTNWRSSSTPTLSLTKDAARHKTCPMTTHS